VAQKASTIAGNRKGRPTKTKEMATEGTGKNGRGGQSGNERNPGDDHHQLSTAYMNSLAFQAIRPLTYDAHQEWQRSRQVALPTSDGTRPPNEGKESKEGMESDLK